MIPLSLRIKRARHRDIAKAQDLIVEEIYKEFENTVLHGGTAIWRCYQGNRFSEDIDVFIPRNIDKINSFFKNLEKKGFIIKKKKISNNSVFSVLDFNRTSARFESLFKSKKGFLKEYETADGNFITVHTLTPEELIIEKISAYLKRFKVRDLYDIFFLLRYVKDKNKVLDELKKLIKKFKEPADKEELKTSIIDGITPKIDEMLFYMSEICHQSVTDGRKSNVS